MSVIAYAVSYEEFEELGECPSFINQQQAFTEYQVKEPEEIDLDGLKELFEDSICNQVVVEVVDCTNSSGNGEAIGVINGDERESIVISPCSNEDIGDYKWLPNMLDEHGVLQCSESGNNVNATTPVEDYYSGTMALKRIYQEKTNIYGQTYCRYWFDRGK